MIIRGFKGAVAIQIPIVLSLPRSFDYAKLAGYDMEI